MINKMKPLCLAEVKDLIGDIEDKKELDDYIKKFGNLSKEDSLKLGEEIRELDNMKVKEEHIVKIVDFIPKNSEELNKIFTDISLDEEECNKILEIVKGY